MSEINWEDEEIKIALEEKISKATEGLVNKNRELLTKLSETKDTMTALENRAKEWEGVDLDAIKAVQERLANDEDAKLIAEGKIDEVVSKRTQNFIKDFNAKTEAFKAREEALQRERDEAITGFRSLKITTAVQQAAAEAGVIPEAVTDVLFKAKTVFRVEDGDNLVARDGDNIQLNSEGEPMTPSDWVKSLKKTSPHYWPASKSGGAGGSGGSGVNNDLALDSAKMKDMESFRKHRQANKAS